MKETQGKTAARPVAAKPPARPGAPTNGQQAIQAMSAARAANNYKQGMFNGTPANTWGAAPGRGSAPKASGPISPNYGGTNNTRPIYEAQVSGAAPIGYTPGSFNDPSIDWNAIASIFGPQARQEGSNTDWNGGGTVERPSVMAPPTPPVFETPAVYTSPPAAVEAPGIVATTQGNSLPNVQSFDTVGRGIGTFGMFDRMRNARNPRQGISVTPEMLRRAAQARMGTGA